jgi:CubicO group peptidase (beta-lactamase class C family)
VLLAAGRSGSGSAARSELPPEIHEGAIDRFIAEQMAAHRVPGLAVAITRGDSALHVKGYGTAGGGRPVTPRTQFYLASVSKSFTALAVVQLAEAGRIDLDAPVQRYLPELALADPAPAARITVRHLLNQVSGLADAGFPAHRLPQPATIEARVADLRLARPVAPPGTEFHYFDPNYAVLARVVEVAGGQPFAEYLQAHVFAPLRMTRTFGVVTSAGATRRADGLAQGHLMAFGVPFPYPEMTGYLAGSGGVISTAEDMAHYLMAQSSGGRYGDTRLLSPEGLAQLRTPRRDLGSAYGMGWFEATHDGEKVLEHNGILSTFYADIALVPATGHGLVLLYNVSSLESTLLPFPGIKAGLLALLRGGRPSPRGFTVGTWGLAAGALTLLGTSLAWRSLLHLPRWAARTGAAPIWRLLPGIAWSFAPALALLGLPALIAATTDRVFGYEQLVRSMLSLAIGLGLCAVLGIVNGVGRVVLLARRATRRYRRASSWARVRAWMRLWASSLR